MKEDFVYDTEEESNRMEEHHSHTAPYNPPNTNWVKKVVIVGAGGFGREAAEIARRMELSSRSIQLIGFLDDNKALHNTFVNGIRVLGGLDYFKDSKQKPYFACSIGDPIVKRRLVMRILRYGYKPINLIDPQVEVFTGVKLGKGIIIQKGTCLAVNSIIEDHVHVNFNCSIGHDVHLGKYSTISPLCAVSGNTIISNGCFLGSGAITFPGIIIGEWTKLGAGSVATKDLERNCIYIDNPAILHRRLK